jgi:dUTP pyrophosphatase
MKVKFKKLHADAKLPTYGTEGAAGADVYAIEGGVIPPNGRVLVRTGLGCEVPHGFEIQVRPRSGLAFKHGVTVLNSPGTIDEDYRGELCVLLINHHNDDVEVKVGDRVAQIVIAPTYTAEFEWTEELSETERGAGGFGSTGK